MPEQPEQPKSSILRISQKELNRMIESGEAQVLSKKEREPNRDLLRTTWQDVFNHGLQQAHINMNIEVPEVTVTDEELKTPIRDIRGVDIEPMGFYFPKELQGKQGEAILLKMLTALGMPSYYINPHLSEVEEQPGWSTVEHTSEAMYLDKSQKQVKPYLAEHGRTLMGKNQLLTFALFKKVTTGQFPLKQTACFLANNSLDGGRVGYANFYSGGSLAVNALLGPDNHGPNYGALSLGVKK